MSEEQETDFYAPDMDAAKPLKILEEDEAEDFETRLDEKVIFQRVAKELYKYPSSAIRELLVNAIGHGCRKANDKYGENNKAYVDIHLHPHDRKLVITDVRGMGMTHAQIKNLMSYVGRSGNFDSKTAGQFGMGFFSYLKVADSCIIHTKVREPYEFKGKKITSMSYLNNSGWQWQKINTTDEEVNIEEPGTRLELTLNHDIEIDDVISTIKSISRYQDILVQLTLDDDYGRLAAGEVEIPQTADLSAVHVEEEEQETIVLDDDDVYFKAVMYRNSYGHLSHDGEKVVTLARVPIEIDRSIIPTFTGYVLNIKNERKYIPLPDRERLAVKSEDALKAKLESLFKEYFGKLTGTNPEEIEAMPYKYPVIFMRSMGLERYFTGPTKEFINSIVDHTVAYVKYDSATVKADYGAPHTLHQVLAYRQHALLVHNKALAPIRAVQNWCTQQGLPEKKFIRIDKNTSDVAQSLLTEWKIPKIRDFMKANGIKGASSNSKSATGLTLHYSTNWSRETERINDFEDIDYSKTVWIKGPLKPWMNLIGGTGTELKITKWNKKAVEYGIENEESIITDATLYGINDFKIISTKGVEKLSDFWDRERELLRRRSSIVIYKDNENKFKSDKEQTLYTLEQLKINVARYNEDPIYFRNAVIFKDKKIKIHDIDGNEVELDTLTNLDFLIEAYFEILNDTEFSESVDEQIENSEIKLPASYKNLGVDSEGNTVEITDANELYKHNSWIAENEIQLTTKLENDITETEEWKVFVLDIKDYFGIENKYSEKYNWQDNFDVVTSSKDAIDDVFENEDMRQMLLHVVTVSDYTDYRNSLGKFDKNVKVATKKFFKALKNSIDDIDGSDSLEVFFKTRHALNNFKQVKRYESSVEQTAHLEALKLNYDAHDYILQLKEQLTEINRKTKISGNYERFLNEFVKGSESKVVEDDDSISVTCNHEYFINIKSLIELHSRMELYQVEPDNEKIKMIFIPHSMVEINNNLNQSNRYVEVRKYCGCGCENYTVEKFNKSTSEDD